MDGHQPGAGGDRVQEEAGVADPDDRLRVRGDERVVQAGQEPVGVLAAACAHHRRDRVVGDHGVEIVQEVGGAAGPIPGPAQGVGAEDRLEPSGRERGDPALEGGRVGSRFGGGEGDDADPVALSQRSGKPGCDVQAVVSFSGLRGSSEGRGQGRKAVGEGFVAQALCDGESRALRGAR